MRSSDRAMAARAGRPRAPGRPSDGSREGAPDAAKATEAPRPSRSPDIPPLRRGPGPDWPCRSCRRARPKRWAFAPKHSSRVSLPRARACGGPSPVSSAHASAVASRGSACNIITKSGKRRGHPMRRIKLDKIDRRILRDLQANGRMTNVELARRAGISAPPCLRRVRRLEEAGVIRGYHADSDPQKLGWEITFFAIVGLDSQKELVLAAFEQLVANWPEVRECHMIRGGGDFLLKLVARDTTHENLLTQRLTGAPTVTRVQTLQTIRTSRLLAGVPL